MQIVNAQIKRGMHDFLKFTRGVSEILACFRLRDGGECGTDVEKNRERTREKTAPFRINFFPPPSRSLEQASETPNCVLPNS